MSPFTIMDLDCMNTFFTALIYGGFFGDEEDKNYSYYQSVTVNYSLNLVLGLCLAESYLQR